ncbi:hypothetical protein BKA69DRAFT_1087107 [Paraphysoderma sedebokerense]|nr:hypothetical protein BKA69DRAFT_1087107 [Paraphysoderma sedebokerense]
MVHHYYGSAMLIQLSIPCVFILIPLPLVKSASITHPAPQIFLFMANYRLLADYRLIYKYLTVNNLEQYYCAFAGSRGYFAPQVN